MLKLFSWLLALVIFMPHLKSQNDFPFEIVLDTIPITGLPGLHSYTFGQHGDKWLVLGGRRDGIHARQPFRAFPQAFSNDSVFVIDPVQKTVLRSALEGFPISIKEQLQAGNTNFTQVGDTLYIVGGYAFSSTQNNHITFPNLSALSVSGMMKAMEEKTPLTPHVKQITDDYFAVSGGHLQYMNGRFYLVGGHRFDGQYNPMGHNTYVQTYTDQVRIFTVSQSDDALALHQDTTLTDPVHLHRRDYNLMPQILPDGKEGLMISSGVFQIQEDLPFLYPVIISEKSYQPITTFNQYLSHYHSANCALYNPLDKSMHNLFFGGMSQYYWSNGILLKDDLVPFVKTISRVSRNAQGDWKEYNLNAEMPSLTGASAEFIHNPLTPIYSSGIINLAAMPKDSFIIGYIYGGIVSPSENPFSFNQTDLTKADAKIYAVRLVATSSSQVSTPIPHNDPIDILLFPNPTDKNPIASFYLDKSMTMHYFVTNSNGEILQKSIPARMPEGPHDIELPLEDFQDSSLVITFIFDHVHYVSKTLSKL